MSARTAVETIQAAIDVLVEHRKWSTPGPWSVTHDDNGTGIIYEHGETVSSPYVALLSDENGDDFNSDPSGADNDAYLIVTLHRTIDAQLSILNEANLEMMSRERLGLPLNTGPVRALALARAILGEES